MEDTVEIVRIAVTVVGIVEMLKNLLNRLMTTKVRMTLCALVVSVLVSVLYIMLPAETWRQVSIILLAVAGSTVFYDTIYKMFKRLFTGSDTKCEGCSHDTGTD